MANEKFILLDLDNEKSKELAQVISSDTARKILNLLSEKSYAETDISIKLNIPLSTVHYNIQALLKSDIVEVHDFLWSEKGKKINIYKLSNKLIIIAPKNQNNGLSDKLKSIIPAALSGLVITGFLYAYQNSFFRSFVESKKAFIGSSYESSMTLMKSTDIAYYHSPNYALWFFLGMFTIILIYILFSLVKRKN